MHIWNKKKLFSEGRILPKFEQAQLKCNGDDIFHTHTHEGQW